MTRDELFENIAVSVSKQAFTEELDAVLKSGFLKEQDGFILAGEHSSRDIKTRLKRNHGAINIRPIATRFSERIARFPFVEAVMLSGGLSKNCYDEKSDVDYFIITRPNRLWICRTLLIIRYKLLPRASKKYWCTNYFISSDNLVIPDRNSFTATELAYLIPVINHPLYKKLLTQNNWYKNRFPNKSEADKKITLDLPRPFFKMLTERLLGGRFGQWLDNRLLSLTLKRWRRKYPEMNEEDFELQFRSRKDVCKRHTHGFQNRVLQLWQTRKQEFEQRFGVSLSPSK